MSSSNATTKNTMNSVRQRMLDMNLQKDNIHAITEHEEVAEIKTKENKTQKRNNPSIKSIEDRFGIKKVDKLLRDSQASFRIPKEIHDRFREIVRELYYPQKPNYNETLVQILTEFVKTFEKENNEDNE